MLEAASFIVVNKFEKPRSEDALRDIRKQYRRNHNLFAGHPGSPDDIDLPIYGTMASKYNDFGVNALFKDVAQNLGFEVTSDLEKLQFEKESKDTKLKIRVIPNIGNTSFQSQLNLK